MKPWAPTALLLALPLVYYVAFGRTRIHEIDSLQQQARELDAKIPSRGLDAARARDVSRDLEQLEELADQLHTRLATRTDAPPLLLTSSALLRSFGLATERAENAPALDQPRAGFDNERVDLVVTGAFPNLFRFIAQVENEQPASRVTALVVRATANPGKVRASLSLERFWRRDS